jgi:sulfur carrier protein ThiS
MEIINEVSRSTETLAFSGSVQELLLHLKINPETVLVTRQDEVLLEAETVEDSDTITILSVVSGG